MPDRRPDRFEAAFAALPLVAILRGLKPDEAVPVARALVDAGFRLIEVPLNSPDPFDSIARIRADAGEEVVVGAGTVTTTADVARLAAIDADLLVMPHADTAVIRAAKQAGLIAVPGVFTATEAFAALHAGADGLKIFPAELMPPAGVKALMAVLPRGTRLLPVGGIGPDTLSAYLAAGAAGFGLGSALYRPGQDAATTAERATRFVSAYRSTAEAIGVR